MSITGGSFGAIAGVAVGGYIIAVAVRNNSMPLFNALKQEKGYAYFLGSLFALGALHKFGPTHKVTDALVVLAIVAVAIKVGTNVDLTALRAKIFAQ